MNRWQKAAYVMAGMVIMAVLSSGVLPAMAQLLEKQLTAYTGITIFVEGERIRPLDANGEPIEAFLYNNTTYLPVRAINEAMGLNVSWDGDNYYVYINAAADPLPSRGGDIPRGGGLPAVLEQGEAGNKPADGSAVDENSADGSAADKNPADGNAADGNAVDKNPTNGSAADNNPANGSAANKNPVDKNSAHGSVADAPPANGNSVDDTRANAPATGAVSSAGDFSRAEIEAMSILGASRLTAAQLTALAQSNNRAAPDIAALYLEIGDIYGIRGDIAFCQAAKETGWWKYGGLVVPEQNNYCGLYATGNAIVGDESLYGADPGQVSLIPDTHGAWFSTPAAGVEAHIQHLYAYACDDPIPRGRQLLDPRFTLVTRGIAPLWCDLGGRWAVPGYDRALYDSYEAAYADARTYGHSIISDYYMRAEW